MMESYFVDLVQGIETSIKENPEQASPRKLFALEVARLGQRLYSNEAPIAWCGVSAPFDLLGAMGVTSCFVEFVGGILASTGMEGLFLEEAEQRGFGRDTCAYHRAVIGAAHKELMPEPDFLVGTSIPCTGGIATVENLARHFNKDLFVLNVPQPDNPAGVDYLAGQLKELCGFVSDHTGQPLDEDQLRRTMDLSNQTSALMAEVYHLAGHMPSPTRSKELSNFGIVMPLLFGREETVEVARAFHDLYAQRIEEMSSGDVRERIRLMWLQNRIQFKQPLIDWLEKEHAAVIVSDELNHVTWDPIDMDDPWRGMARRAISICLNGTVERRVGLLQDLARQSRVHGAINPCHWGCRQATGARGLVADGLKSIGVPVLSLEVDCVDARNFSEGQMRTRLEAFLELLADRPSPWEAQKGA